MEEELAEVVGVEEAEVEAENLDDDDSYTTLKELTFVLNHLN